MTAGLTTIQGLLCFPLKIIGDERGAVLHMVRCDAPGFDRFGEIYFSEVKAGVIKGWKRHERMTQRFAVPSGQIKLVVYDDREGSPSKGQVRDILIGRPSHYSLIVVPPMVWYGFQAVGGTDALLVNCADIPHDPGESETRRLDDARIPYAW